MVPVGQFATVLNIGIGDGIYNGPNDSGANVFGSAAFYFTQQISLLAEYTGRFTTAALSVAPFRSFPLTVTLGATNLRSEERRDGKRWVSTCESRWWTVYYKTNKT